MAFNIADFKASGLQFNGARPTQFEVIMTPPLVIGANIKGRLKFLIKATQIPPAIIDRVNVPYFGRDIALSGDRTFPDWTITVMNDADFAARTMFEAWSNKMNALVSNYMSRDVFPLDYKADMQVRQFAMDGQVAREYTIHGGFPTQIAPISLDWDAKSRIEEFDVTIAYDWWTPNDSLGIDSSTVDNISEGLLNPSSP